MTYEVQRIRVIAYLFIVIGAAAWLQFLILYWSQNAIAPGAEMILLPCGIGLLRRSEFWRKVSVGLVSAGILVVIAVPILGYTVSPVLRVRIHGAELDPGSLAAIVFVIVYVALLLTCLFWVVFALRAVDVRTYFREK